jgi:hypothetical protein
LAVSQAERNANVAVVAVTLAAGALSIDTVGGTAWADAAAVNRLAAKSVESAPASNFWAWRPGGGPLDVRSAPADWGHVDLRFDLI